MELSSIPYTVVKIKSSSEKLALLRNDVLTQWVSVVVVVLLLLFMCAAFVEMFS